jgi:hypothetical protein
MVCVLLLLLLMNFLPAAFTPLQLVIKTLAPMDYHLMRWSEWEIRQMVYSR